MSEVFVYIYDISKGFVSQLSLQLLGKHISGIWHTGIVVFGKEFFFGSNGIESYPPGGTMLGEPNEKLKLGNTNKNENDLDVHLKKLSENIFNGSKYDLLHHNCNTFSNELSIWLTGQNIPTHVTSLPGEILDTPFGKMIKPYIDQFSPAVSTAYQGVTTYYNRTTINTPSLNIFYYEEALGSKVEAFLRNEISFNKQDYNDIFKGLVLSIKGLEYSYISEEIINIIELTETKDLLNIDTRIVIFDILRLFILKDIENVVLLFVDPIIWIRAILKESCNDELNVAKCKFICNLIGKHFEVIRTNNEILKIISNFALICMRYQSTSQSASSLVRNIVINMSALDVESILEISSFLIHLLVDDELIRDDIAKENIVGSVYFLVKNSELAKDLAKAQDIHKRIRRETQFCQLLCKELQ